MRTLREAVTDFLAQKRLAVAGVSRDRNQAANAVYRKLRRAGYEVFPVNPAAREVDGDSCYPDLQSIPGGVGGVVIVTRPAVASEVVRQCARLGITRVWMHRSFGPGSVSKEAVDFCRANGITAIDGGCPLMFCPPVDIAHHCMRWILRWSGGLPRSV